MISSWKIKRNRPIYKEEREQMKKITGFKKGYYIRIIDGFYEVISAYNKDLAEALRPDDNTPQCLKVEKETVLRNMIKLLEHLNSLKK